MTIQERLEIIDDQIKAIREELERTNAHDYSSTTGGSTTLANDPPRPRGFGRRVGFGLPEIIA